VRLAITVLGLDLFAIDITTDAPSPAPDGPGDCTTMPLGFTASPGDQRWEAGALP
jgi:hypothetical protein